MFEKGTPEYETELARNVARIQAEQLAASEDAADGPQRDIQEPQNIQRRMVGGLCHDIEAMTELRSHIRPGQWENEAHKAVIRVITTYFDGEEKLPPLDIIQYEVSKVIEEKDPKTKKYFLDEIDKLYNETPTKYAIQKYKNYIHDEEHRVALFNACRLTEKKEDNKDGTWRERRLASWAKWTELDLDMEDEVCRLDKLDEIPDPVWQVEDFWTTGSLVEIFGPSKVGKSFLALDIALCVAKGMPYLGKYPTVKGSVFYMAAEGHSGMKTRAPAWAKYNQTSLPTNFMFRSAKAYDMKEATTPQKILRDFEKEIGGVPDLVVIDTLNRSMPGTDESIEDMGLFVDNMTRLMEKGCTVLVVHHTGKNKDLGGRGGSNLFAAMDTVFFADGNIDAVEVECHKQKEAEEMDGLVLTRDRIYLGQNEAGKDINSMILKWLMSLAEYRNKTKVDVAVAYETALLNQIPESTIEQMDESNGSAGITRKQLKLLLPKVSDHPFAAAIRALRESGRIAGKKYKAGASSPEYLWQETLLC